jgi:hypothetical protein
MPIIYRWENQERTLILLTYPPKWKWEELYGVQRDVNAQLDNTQLSVTMIQDFSKSPMLPPSAIVHIKNLVFRIHPRIRVMIYVGMNRFVRTMWDTFVRMYGKRLFHTQFLFANTVEEARKMASAVEANATRT